MVVDMSRVVHSFFLPIVNYVVGRHMSFSWVALGVNNPGGMVEIFLCCPLPLESPVGKLQI